jgi:adenosine deaminase
MVQTMLEHPREEVVGIGMDYAEADNPPEKSWKTYRLAGERGLRRTAHAREDAPARNVEACLVLLGCERIDHGYHSPFSPDNSVSSALASCRSAVSKPSVNQL